jgi:IS5 family transposase
LVKRVEPKRSRNWQAIDAAGRHRGELMAMYITSEVVLAQPKKSGPKGGRAQRYADDYIEAVLAVKLMQRCSLRAAEGYVRAILVLLKLAVPTPDHTTLSRRARKLEVALGARLDPNKRYVLVADSTGLKVFGEGEWKTKVHGTNIHRTWRKVHLVVDRESGQIIEVVTTENGTGDAATVQQMLPADLTGAVLLGDGAYHTKELHREVFKRGGVLLTPPPKNAKRWGRQTRHRDEPAFRFRNKQLTVKRRLGRRRWAIGSGYSQRSFVETTNHRLKSITGDKLSARTLEGQRVEVRIRCKVLNRLAVPSSVLAPPPLPPTKRPLSVRQLIEANAFVA